MSKDTVGVDARLAPDFQLFRVVVYPLLLAPLLAPMPRRPSRPRPAVGRVERLPRERAPLATLAPPLSPLKAGAPKPAERLQFHSILAE